MHHVLREAMDRKASDVHITTGLPIMFRLSGELWPYGTEVLTSNDTSDIIYKLIQDDGLRAQLELNGQVDCAISVPGVGRFRANAYKQRGSNALALRPVNSKVPSASDLNLPKQLVQDVLEANKGLILVTGPTGSGKSTTLAALINEINTNRRRHIITLEDPIEFLHRHNKSMVNQREIGLDCISYAQGLKGALREDPDVILIGEMRDVETISIALEAAETGHLVFSTLHTISASETVSRVVSTFPAEEQDRVRAQLALVLSGVVSQQLIPKVGGGRALAMEYMRKSTAISTLIRDDKLQQIRGMIKNAKAQGMMEMDDSILELFKQGLITEDNAIYYAREKDEVRSDLAKIKNLRRR